MNTQTKNTMLRLSLALTLAGTLAACEDAPTPPAKPRSSVTEAPPAPPATPTPTPTSPPATPEVKPDPVIVKPDGKDVQDEEDEKPVDAIAAARKMLDAGEVDKAFELAKVATLRFPKRSAAWNVRGRAELRAGKRADAIASFEKAVELNPKSSYARNNLGLALIYDEQYEKAADSLEAAVELEPVTAYMWNNLGMAYEQLDRLDDAREAYGNAVTMESDRARASLARLKGVESIIRTAKAEPEPKVPPGATEGTPPGAGSEEKPTATP
ncbi:MAG TPA: tetratricopeptide repeat protein [Polyangia bacterium]|nr:tetratricopeptide repeat protein [Polyangia bacterium]